MNHQRISRGDPKPIGNLQRLSEESLGGFFGGEMEKKQFQRGLEEVFSTTLALELARHDSELLTRSNCGRNPRQPCILSSPLTRGSG